MSNILGDHFDEPLGPVSLEAGTVHRMPPYQGGSHMPEAEKGPPQSFLSRYQQIFDAYGRVVVLTRADGTMEVMAP